MLACLASPSFPQETRQDIRVVNSYFNSCRCPSSWILFATISVSVLCRVVDVLLSMSWEPKYFSARDFHFVGTCSCTACATQFLLCTCSAGLLAMNVAE